MYHNFQPKSTQLGIDLNFLLPFFSTHIKIKEKHTTFPTLGRSMRNPRTLRDLTIRIAVPYLYHKLPPSLALKPYTNTIDTSTTIGNGPLNTK